jgi:cytochrome c553
MGDPAQKTLAASKRIRSKSMRVKHFGILVGTAACIVGFSGTVLADGKATFDAICSECHAADDFEGETVDDIQEMISQIVNGEIEHKKKLELTDQQIADMAAFYASGGK